MSERHDPPTPEKRAESRELRDHRDAAELDLDEQLKAEEEESLNASVTHEVIRREGVREIHRKPAALAWSGLAAGLSMGLSMAAEGALHAHLPPAEWRPLVAKMGYPFGFIIVILGSQQLFTENTLTPVVPLLVKRTEGMLRKLGTLWAVVLVANLVGTLLFAWAAAYTAAFPPEVRHAFTEIGRSAAEPGWLALLARAVVAGWIIALMVWMLPAASSQQVLVIFLMTWLIGALKLAHIIAGSAEVLYLAAVGEISYGHYLVNWMLPTLIGNVVGGVALVTALNHQQVKAG
jgi:formate-nitrite transporter family protein